MPSQTPRHTPRTEDDGATVQPRKYKALQLHNLRSIEQVAEHLSEADIRATEVVGHVFPFKTNNYVVDELIRWEDAPKDPMFILNFPQEGMLSAEHFALMSSALDTGDKAEMDRVANAIRLQLNPHPAGQMEHNVPDLYGETISGMQHKYPETVLFFPSQGQTCHAYCSFCFRWPQFVGMDDLKFAMSEVEKLIEYVRENPRVSDVLFTGGDPMVMSPKVLDSYIRPLIEANLPNLRTIRIGSKSLSYWPYKYVTDPGADQVLDTFRAVTESGRQLAFMAHFNHPVELSTPVVREAIRRIRATGAVIRSQTPVLRHINDDAQLWVDKWRSELAQGIIPYYMFVVRDTGAQAYFGVPLVEAWTLYRDAYQRVSGLGRTVRGPSMSAEPGKVEVLGTTMIGKRQALALRFLQGRNPDWVGRVFFAEHDPEAIWLDELKPFGASRFFFEEELATIYRAGKATGAVFQDEETGDALRVPQD